MKWRKRWSKKYQKRAALKVVFIDLNTCARKCRTIIQFITTITNKGKKSIINILDKEQNTLTSKLNNQKNNIFSFLKKMMMFLSL